MPVRSLAELAANEVAKNASTTLAGSDEFTQTVVRQNVSAKHLAASWFSRTDEARRLQELEVCHRIAALDASVPVDPDTENGLRLVVFDSPDEETRRLEARLNAIVLVHMAPGFTAIRMTAELEAYFDENPDGFTKGQIEYAKCILDGRNYTVNYHRFFGFYPILHYSTAAAGAADAAA